MKRITCVVSIIMLTSSVAHASGSGVLPSLEKYRPGKNDADYVITDYDVKEVEPYEFEEAERTKSEYSFRVADPGMYILPKKSVPKVAGNAESVTKGDAAVNTQGFTTYDAVDGATGPLVTKPSQLSLKFPYRSGAVITSFFGWRRLSSEQTGRFHTGVDFVGNSKDIYASGKGVVVDVDNKGGWGKYLAIEYESVAEASGVAQNPEVAEKLRGYAKRATGSTQTNGKADILEGADKKGLEDLLSAAGGAGGANKLAQDEYQGKLMEEYVKIVQQRVPNLADPRSFVLICDMMNTSSNLLGFLDRGNIKSTAGTAAEFEAVHDCMMNYSYWAGYENKNQRQYIEGWKNRMKRNYDKVKNMSLPAVGTNEFYRSLGEITGSNEGSYTSVNGNDAGEGFSVGRYQFHLGKARDALNLIASYLDGSVQESGGSASTVQAVLFYAHLKTIHVKVGDTVDADTIIAVEGQTGGDWGVHLHLSGYVGDRYKYEKIVKTPTTIPALAGAGTMDPLSKIFGCLKQSDTPSKIGFELKAVGAEGNTTARITQEQVDDNKTLGANAVEWN